MSLTISFRASCASALLVFVLAACSSKSSDSGAKAGDAGSKLPSTAGGKAAGPGKKGGGAGTQPSATASSAGSKTTASSLKKAVTPTGDNPCANVPDGKATCASDTGILFCAGQQLYQLDCNALMTSPENGFAAGACIQNEGATDCFGCGTDENGANVCCTSVADGTLCCDDASQCVTVSN